MAGGENLGPVEAGFLDTPTFNLALLLFFMLAFSMLFEWSTKRLKLYLRRRKRNGLAQAVTNLVNEVTLVGLISLLLIVLQDPISKICMSYSPGVIETWTLIGNVRGCDCCLKYTDTVGSCFPDSRECGPEFCNCEAKDPSCLVPEISLSDLLYQWGSDANCNITACNQGYLEQAAANPQVQAAKEVLDLQCDGMVRVEDGVCGAGKTQLITITALHQVHIFIFTVAMTHVFLGVVMILLSSWRLQLWRRACGDEDDHARGVRKLLDGDAEEEVKQAPPSGWSRILSSRLLAGTLSRTRTMRSRDTASPQGAASPAAAPGSPKAAAAAAAAAEAGTAGHPEVGGDAPAAGNRMRGVVFAALAASKKAAADAQPVNGEVGNAGEGGAQNGSSSPPAAGAPAAEGGQEAFQADGTGGADTTAPAEAPQRPKSIGGAFLSRSASIKQGDISGNLKEYAICLAHSFNPTPVTTEDLRLMRASFMLTHRVPTGFDFWNYITVSMEDDFSQIVGVSLEMWATLVVFVLISGPLGWVALPFVVLSALVLVAVNVKIIWVIRHVCRGARVNTLTSHVFWFGRPDMLLHPIKYVLFLASFMFSSAIFFVWSFGSESCPFTAAGNAFWLAWLPPWWLVLIISGLIFVDAAMIALPCYSLAVQMGSDFKQHMLPSGVKNKLLLIAERVKAKHKAILEQEAAEAAAAEGSQRGGSMRGSLGRGAKELLTKSKILVSAGSQKN
ncbi:MLO-like protein 14 [Chlorella vulgaris]